MFQTLHLGGQERKKERQGQRFLRRTSGMSRKKICVCLKDLLDFFDTVFFHN